MTYCSTGFSSSECPVTATHQARTQEHGLLVAPNARTAKCRVDTLKLHQVWGATTMTGTQMTLMDKPCLSE